MAEEGEAGRVSSMRKSSAAASTSVPQFGVASGGASRNKPLATLAEAIKAKVESIRSLIAAEGRPGFNSDVAGRMNWRRERISREIQGVEKLSVSLLLAEIECHRAEGRDAIADRLVAAITEGQPVKIRTDRALVIRMSDGQLFLDLQDPETKS